MEETDAGPSFLAFLAAYPSVSRTLLATLARQFIEHEYFVEDLVFLDLKGRVAKRMLLLAGAGVSDLPPDGVSVAAGLTHADIASLCGGTRANISRILSEFQRRGLIRRDGRTYTLEDIGSLVALAGGKPN